MGSRHSHYVQLPARRDRSTVERSSPGCGVLARLSKVEINSDPTYRLGCRAIPRCRFRSWDRRVRRTAGMSSARVPSPVTISVMVVRRSGIRSSNRGEIQFQGNQFHVLSGAVLGPIPWLSHPRASWPPG